MSIPKRTSIMPPYENRSMAPARTWSSRNRAVSNCESSGAPAGVPVSSSVPTNTTSGSAGTSQPAGTGTSHWRPPSAGAVVVGPGGRLCAATAGADDDGKQQHGERHRAAASHRRSSVRATTSGYVLVPADPRY